MFGDKKSVSAYNVALDEMFIIFDTIKEKFGESGIKEFSSLLSIKEDNLRFWAAALLQDRSKTDDKIADKALKIITSAATGDDAEIFLKWLENFENTRYF